jgi:hypothetical protein
MKLELTKSMEYGPFSEADSPSANQEIVRCCETTKSITMVTRLRYWSLSVATILHSPTALKMHLDIIPPSASIIESPVQNIPTSFFAVY